MDRSKIYIHLQQLVSTCLARPHLMVGLRILATRHACQPLHQDWPCPVLTNIIV